MVDRGQERPEVAVIGLGSMGMGVARSLLRAGFRVRGCDTRRDALDALVAVGGAGFATAREAADGVGVAIVLVVNAEQTEAVVLGKDGAVEGLKPGAVVVASATVAPDFAVQLAARLADRGVFLLDAPVSGGRVKSEQGQLTIMASGSEQAFERAQPVLEAISAKTYRLGTAAGVGSTVKMVNQLLAGVHIAAAAEAMALGLRCGADPHALYDVISNSAGSSWMFQNRVPHILAGDYSPLSAVNIFVKDLGIVLDSGRRNAFPLPLTAAAHQMFMMAAAAGLGREDDSAVIKIFPGIRLPAGEDNEEVE